MAGFASDSAVHAVCEVFVLRPVGSAILDCTNRQLIEVPMVTANQAAITTHFWLNRNGIEVLPETAFAGMSTLK